MVVFQVGVPGTKVFRVLGIEYWVARGEMENRKRRNEGGEYDARF